MSQLQSVRFSNLPSQTIPNPRGNASVVMLRSRKELPQPTLQQLPRPTEDDSELNADSQSRPEKTVPLSFPTRTISTRKLERVVEDVQINIPLLDSIKQIPKYAKLLKELCVHKRKKMKGSVEVGGIVSALTRNEEFTAGAQQALPNKCLDPKIFSIPCTIGDCTFADAMLNLGASINVMPTSIYKSLKFGDLEPTRMTIQLANRSVVQPLGILEDVLVQVNEVIFPADFYVLDMEDETLGKGTTLILGRPFLMTARTKIDVYAGTLSMEFGDTLVQFNIFEAVKHPTEDHSLFGIDLIDELVEEYLQLDNSSEDGENFAGSTDLINFLGSITREADYEEVHDLPNFEDNNNDIVDVEIEAELFEGIEATPNHLKYAYLDTEQQLPIIIANNLLQEQEDKLLNVLRQHKKAIGWKLSYLPGINPSICMHNILMEEEAKPIRKKQIRLNPTILDVVKKEVTKLLAVGIIYPISDS
ncbi:hypothetical protein CR513_36928, partial [Mucuna pruriens]